MVGQVEVVHYTICFGQMQEKLYRISKKFPLALAGKQLYAVVRIVQVVQAGVCMEIILDCRKSFAHKTLHHYTIYIGTVNPKTLENFRKS